MLDSFKQHCALCDQIYFSFFMLRKNEKYICKNCKKLCDKYNSSIYNYSIDDLKKCIEKRKSVSEIIKEEKILQREKEFLKTMQDINFISPKITSTKTSRHFLKDMPILSHSSIRKNTPDKILENFVVIDTETTGLYPASDEILEISAIKFVDANPVECLTTLLKPKKQIPVHITNINHITNSLVENSPNISNVINEFSDFIKGFNIVGYNLDFDIKFLHVNGMNFFEEKRKFFDALDLCRKYFNKCYVDNFKLDTICEKCNIYRPQAHRATEDALATGIIFRDIGYKIKNK